VLDQKLEDEKRSFQHRLDELGRKFGGITRAFKTREADQITKALDDVLRTQENVT
jgi:hypothetical protein